MAQLSLILFLSKQLLTKLLDTMNPKIVTQHLLFLLFCNSTSLDSRLSFQNPMQL